MHFLYLFIVYLLIYIFTDLVTYLLTHDFFQISFTRRGYRQNLLFARVKQRFIQLIVKSSCALNYRYTNYFAVLLQLFILVVHMNYASICILLLIHRRIDIPNISNKPTDASRSPVVVVVVVLVLVLVVSMIILQTHQDQAHGGGDHKARVHRLGFSSRQSHHD